MKRLSVVMFILVLFFLAGCQQDEGEMIPTPHPIEETAAANMPTIMPAITPTPTASPPTTETEIDGYEFPTSIDATQRYLFYLHGKIIEDQGIPAVSSVFGAYQYAAILGALQGYGFEVISEQRPKDADAWASAQRTAGQVTELLTAGVPPNSITVVGASKGAAIAALVSHLVGDPEVNYVLLATCHPTQVAAWVGEGLTLSGNVLAIRDVADDEYAGSCQELFSLAEGKGINHHDEILLQVGTGHGILYQPLPEWVLPTVSWANQEW